MAMLAAHQKSFECARSVVTSFLTKLLARARGNSQLLQGHWRTFGFIAELVKEFVLTTPPRVISRYSHKKLPLHNLCTVRLAAYNARIGDDHQEDEADQEEEEDIAYLLGELKDLRPDLHWREPGGLEGDIRLVQLLCRLFVTLHVGQDLDKPSKSAQAALERADEQARRVLAMSPSSPSHRRQGSNVGFPHGDGGDSGSPANVCLAGMAALSEEIIIDPNADWLSLHHEPRFGKRAFRFSGYDQLNSEEKQIWEALQVQLSWWKLLECLLHLCLRFRVHLGKDDATYVNIAWAFLTGKRPERAYLGRAQSPTPKELGRLRVDWFAMGAEYLTLQL